jgi:hypothetical protein
LLAKIRKCDSLIRSPNEAGHGEGEWRRKEGLFARGVAITA